MLVYDHAVMQPLAVHWVGTSHEEDGILSGSELKDVRDPAISAFLKEFFLRNFCKQFEVLRFHDENGPQNNKVFESVSNIFDNENTLIEESEKLANYLYDASDKPQIKGGEFFTVLFKELRFENEVVEAIGLFKSEHKDKFLKVEHEQDRFIFNVDEGIHIQKLDKGALIFNTEKEEGYKVLVIDQHNKTGASLYWKENFLNLRVREDHYQYTREYLDLCKNFVDDIYNPDHNVSRPDQIDMLNRSLQFFNSKNNFEEEQFQSQVIREPEVIEAFQDYKTQHSDTSRQPIPSSFDIHPAAVNTCKRVFKSVLKLDKNFHIYIHGNRDFIQRGYDEKTQLSYYKIFFENEQ